MNNIALCIPTYKRPSMLEELLVKLAEIEIDTQLIREIYVIVIDNDIDKSAESVVNRLANRFTAPFSIYYHLYSLKGLSNIRNELLRKALAKNPKYIVFIDDDEFPATDWLNNLIGAIVRNKADIVRGPVVSSFVKKVPENISVWFKHPNYPPNTKISSVATNNLAISVDSLLKNNIWFDDRFNFTGAEDAYFGFRMVANGASIFWAPDALVYETVPANKSNIGWLIRRKFNGGANYIYMLKLDKLHNKQLKKFMVSIVYIFLGFLGLILLLFPAKFKYWGILKLAEGTGGLSGILKLRITAYK